MNPLAAIAALGDGVELSRTKVMRFAHRKVEGRCEPKSAYVVKMDCGRLEVVKCFKLKTIPFQNEPSFRSAPPDPVAGTLQPSVPALFPAFMRSANQEMIALLLFAVFYVALPNGVHRAVWRWTGSAEASWVAAILAIPLGSILYVRLFEGIKHRGRRGWLMVSASRHRPNSK
ncbi:MAG: hypothetical protein K2X03_08080 [Bryobacteraceae bacterium]|nr:hypothetical protein [Bryobacteraceae bacterium]